ncbi:MAG TPA: LysE family transporter [Patescibacteria group bacterium]|nr:LysE family transporter [Patescibacteria group bacterium]
MLVYFLAGCTFGLSAGFSPGPLFAMVISQTMKHGLKEGVKTALSPLLTDLPIIILTTTLLSFIQDLQTMLGLISLGGGLFLAHLAYENMITEPSAITHSGEKIRSIAQGAMVNALSPHPYLFWITVGSPMLLEAYSHGVFAPALFIVSFYFSLVGAKILLAVTVNSSRDFLTGKLYSGILKTLGIIVAAFSLLLFKEAWDILMH